VKILVLNGPNLNRLGRRDPDAYGTATLGEIRAGLDPLAEEMGIELTWVQSNHEARLIEALQAAADEVQGVLLNAGALTHYGYALADAIRDFGGPVVEVHLSNVHAREAWRRRSVLAEACVGGVYGFGPDSYRAALVALGRRLGA